MLFRPDADSNRLVNLNMYVHVPLCIFLLFQHNPEEEWPSVPPSWLSCHVITTWMQLLRGTVPQIINSLSPNHFITKTPKILVKNGSDNGLLPDGAKPLLEPILNRDYWHLPPCNFAENTEDVLAQLSYNINVLKVLYTCQRQRVNNVIRTYELLCCDDVVLRATLYKYHPV